MRLFSYVVARDYGFAPNPFFGFCTLATCKPVIRRTASVGDWVIGTGSRAYGISGRLVFAMLVENVVSYDEYWGDPRFSVKRPSLRGSLKRAFGDNIYHHDPASGAWIQEDSHHSNHDGTANIKNIRHDTNAPRVLIATDFTYWGGAGPEIPAGFRKPTDICSHRGHQCRFPEALVTGFIEWVRGLDERGYRASPVEFPHG